MQPACASDAKRINHTRIRGAQRRRLRSCNASTPAQQTVMLTLRPARISDLPQVADIYAHCSLREPHSLAISEARP